MNCVQVVSESRELIHDLESTISELKKENQGLAIKLSEMAKIFNRFRQERNGLTKGANSFAKPADHKRSGAVTLDSKEEVTTEGDRNDSIDDSKHESNVSSDVAVSVSDSGNGSNACASDPSSQASAGFREEGQTSPAGSENRDSLIQELRTQVKKLRRELQMRETEYEDLLRKYEMMKAKYKDSMSGMR